MICTCDNCHYTFSADELPTWCSHCRQDSRHHKFASKILSVPCVRPATDDEAAQYEKVVAEERDETDLVEKLRMLGEPDFEIHWHHEDEESIEEEQTKDEDQTVDEAQTGDEVNPLAYPPDPYNLSVHEHNFALMLVYYLKQMGRFYGRLDLEKMIMGEDVDEKVALYKNVKKIFTCGINDEERWIEKPLHVNMEIWNAATPALKTLYAFRQDDDFKRLLADAPNRGNIKRIDVQALAEHPSEGFVRFMTELYNGMKE